MLAASNRIGVRFETPESLKYKIIIIPAGAIEFNGRYLIVPVLMEFGFKDINVIKHSSLFIPFGFNGISKEFQNPSQQIMKCHINDMPRNLEEVWESIPYKWHNHRMKIQVIP